MELHSQSFLGRLGLVQQRTEVLLVERRSGLLAGYERPRELLPRLDPWSLEVVYDANSSKKQEPQRGLSAMCPRRHTQIETMPTRSPLKLQMLANI